MSPDFKQSPSERLQPLIKRVLSLAMPMAGSRLIQMLSGFIGMAMLAHLGAGVLSASALMTSTQIAIIVSFISLLFSASVVVGQAYGAKQYYEIGSIMREACVLSLMLVLPMVALFLVIDHILLWAGQLPSLVSYVRVYFHAFIWGTPAYVLIAALQQSCYGMNKQRFVIISNLCALCLFILSAYVLIFGKFGIPAQGVAGLPYAFAIQAYFNVCFMLCCFYFQKQFAELQFFSRRKNQGWKYLRQLLQIGWPMSVQFGGELLGLFVVTVMVGWLGKAALAASQVAQQWMFLFIVPMFAIAESAGIFVSQSVGAKRYRETRHTTNVCVWILTVFAILATLLFAIFPKPLASLYINVNDIRNAATVHLIRILLVLLIFFLTFESWRHIFAGSLRGLYDTRFAMWVGILIIWFVSIPLGYLFGFTFHWGVIGFRVASSIALFTGAILLFARWRQRSGELIESQLDDRECNGAPKLSVQ